jgi:hypothetical protein
MPGKQRVNPYVDYLRSDPSISPGKYPATSASAFGPMDNSVFPAIVEAKRVGLGAPSLKGYAKAVHLPVHSPCPN